MEFFVVTTTSVYLLKDKKDEEGKPIVEKNRKECVPGFAF